MLQKETWNFGTFYYCFLSLVNKIKKSQTTKISEKPFSPNILTSNYLFKVNNGDIRTMCEILSKLTRKPKRRHWRLSDFFVVNFEHISHIVTVFPLLTLNK